MRRPLRAALAAAALFACASSSFAASELVMVELRSCTYCAKFQREIAPSYSATSAGKIAPLRLVSAMKRWPKDLAGVRRAPYTPVFILVEDGREVGRFAGYTNADAFWSKLQPLLKKL